MKIKTLAIAAATLAVGAITSQAQVYSQNIVGYVNSIVPPTSYVFLCNPLTTGNDVLTNVIQGVTGGSLIQLWNGAGWTQYQYKGSPKHWISSVDNTTNDNYVLSPGKGFLLYGAGAGFTNTFSGQIVANSGSSITNGSYNASTYYPVGSLVPFADTITNTATINLICGGGSLLQLWDPVGQKLVQYQYKNGQHSWQNSITSVYTNPVISVGQGFFFSPNATTNWIQTSP